MKHLKRFNESFVDVSDIKSNFICCECGINMGINDKDIQINFTVDRINNNYAHIKGNCRAICHHCNISKK